MRKLPQCCGGLRTVQLDRMRTHPNPPVQEHRRQDKRDANGASDLYSRDAHRTKCLLQSRMPCIQGVRKLIFVGTVEGTNDFPKDCPKNPVRWGGRNARIAKGAKPYCEQLAGGMILLKYLISAKSTLSTTPPRLRNSTVPPK